MQELDIPSTMDQSLIDSNPVAEDISKTLTPVDELVEIWKSYDTRFINLRKELVTMQQEHRDLEKITFKFLRQLQKDALKHKNKGNRKLSGFAKPKVISNELCDFMEREHGYTIARTEATRYIISYVKDHNLAESTNIFPDKKLSVLLGTTEPITYFTLQKYMNKHYVGPAKAPPEEDS